MIPRYLLDRLQIGTDVGLPSTILGWCIGMNNEGFVGEICSDTEICNSREMVLVRVPVQ